MCLFSLYCVLDKYRYDFLFSVNRNPIPDSYMMTLHLIRNFTSAAHVVTCPPTGGSDPPRCPMGYSEGDQYLNRSFTVQCPEMVRLVITASYFLQLIVNVVI